MTPLNGDKVRPRVMAKAGGEMFSWLSDTDASSTCLTSTLFHAAFPNQNPKKVQNSGNRMYSLGIYEIDLQIKGKTFKPHINVIDQLNDNINGIYFMHQHKLHYDV